MEKYYLDNAATTKPFEELANIYKACATDYYNPSALYQGAVDTRIKFENARKNICKSLGGENGGLIFTGSATEANNLALSSVNYKGKKLMVFIGEHPSVYNKAKQIELSGVKVEYLESDTNGHVILPKAEDLKDVALISCMHVSNETGAIQDISSLIKIAKRVNPKILVHCDGVQAFGKIPVDLSTLGVDMYTISAHKIYGPKAVGALWYKRGINITPQIIGGGQELGLRSGTENVFGALALEYCANKVTLELDFNYNKVAVTKQSFLDALTKSSLDFKVNGQDCSPYIANITIPNVRGEVLLHLLEGVGIYTSTGSACSSKKPDNRMLKAMGLTDDEIKCTVRISFSAYDNLDPISCEKVGETFVNTANTMQAKFIKRK